MRSVGLFVVLVVIVISSWVLYCALPARSGSLLPTTLSFSSLKCERLSSKIEYCPRSGSLGWWSPDYIARGVDPGLNADYHQNGWVVGDRMYRIRDLMGRSL